MKPYESMTIPELVFVVRQQDRIIESLVREMKLSKRDGRKVMSLTHRLNISEGRLRLVSPERRREIAQIGHAARAAKQTGCANGTCDG